MFDTIKSLWLGFSGGLADQREARKLVWLLLVAFVFGWIATAYAAWISYPSYFSMISFLPGAGALALAFTLGIAGFLYFDLAYISGFAVERWKKVPASVRDYSTLGARILAVCAIVFLVTDMYMNIQGTKHRAKDAAGPQIELATYQTPGSIAAALADDRARLDDLLQGKLGGYGWRDPRTGVFHLNSSGKKLQRSLSGNLERLQAQDSTKQANFLADRRAAIQAQAELEATAQATLEKGVYGVYIFVFLLTIVQAYTVETIQDKTGHNTPAGAGGGSQRQKQGKGVNTQAAGEALHSGPSAAPVAVAGGWEISCKHCGQVAVKRSPNAKFCSPDCRVQHWENKTGAKVKKGKPQPIGYK